MDHVVNSWEFHLYFLSRQAERAEFERQDSAETKTTDSASEAPSAVTTPKSTEVDSDAESKESKDSVTRTESRQEKLRRQQQEREQEEARRAQDLQRQKALSKAKSAEQKLRLDAKKKLMDQEQALARKEDQVDRDTQRYAIARVKPLGKDRFFNQYWYFDGITMAHATDRLYVQSPSFLDLETMRTREDEEKILNRQAFEDPSCGLNELFKSQESEIIRGITAEKAAKEAAKEKRLQMEKERENDTDDEGDVKANHDHHAGNGGGDALTNGSSQTFSDETKAVEHMSSHWSYYSEPEQVMKSFCLHYNHCDVQQARLIHTNIFPWGIFFNEQIDRLLMWLNAKGVREHSLISAIERQYDLIVGGMQRRHQDLVNQVQREQHRRSTRTKTVQASEGFLGYVNKLNK